MGWLVRAGSISFGAMLIAFLVAEAIVLGSTPMTFWRGVGFGLAMASPVVGFLTFVVLGVRKLTYRPKRIRRRLVASYTTTPPHRAPARARMAVARR